ncbi:hypothetical protein [Allomuricauda sp. d1]|uniref:hypothetical protein n=1 Tax=Allomuricauda sp. d1 TaxID=3136725 RepID=UPI0031D21A0D
MKNHFESQATRIHRWSNFQLPNPYKKIGWSIVIGAFLLMIAKKFVDEPEWVKPLLRNLMILGFLMVSISKEKIEDEFMASLRGVTYRLAFIMGALYTIIQPYIDYGVSYLINGKAELDTSYFQVILFILLVQIMYFNVLKRVMK